ncbi:MAG TPA: efflux RND transporter permease subunit, partial [Candidatus Acidoferrum sp.]|nr:efflux RND transporter permease subunit [Candidatus Acidoferrum sp.]
MAQFFIRRPVVAMVISILIVLVGGVALMRLPVERYPQLSPPNIQVSATYPGASAEIVEQSVATPIEQQVNGVDRMIYMRSVNSSDGRMSLNVTFDVGVDPDVANTLAQNRVAQAQTRLPQDVIVQGITVRKQNPSILMVISIFSPKGTYDSLFLNNYAMLSVRDELLRVKGVSDVNLAGGSEYSMRIWIRPDELARLQLTPADVIASLREQNIQAPAGQIGAAPSARGQEYTYSVRAPSRLSTPEEFGNVMVRSTAEGRVVRVKDIARVELGNEAYRNFGRVNGKDAGVLLVYLLPNANQIETAKGVYQRLVELKKMFPADLDYVIGFDTTPAVSESIKEILYTLGEAILLVVIVVFVFLQNWRATLIPLITVPVSLLGTFAAFPFLGFSVNTLTLFGMVLAIGIVVDDAIVVVEAVMHHIEEGMSPRDATVQAMKEVSGPVIGIALVLSSVFIPVAFLGGLTGRLYQQFALTIAISVIISAFVALSLSPALSSLLLRPPPQKKNWLGRGFGLFNRVFARATNGYLRLAGSLARRAFLSLVIIAIVAIVAGGFSHVLPRGFVPEEDQGILLLNVQLPNAASLERTDHVCRRIEDILSKTPGVESYNVIGGLSFIAGAATPYSASFFMRLKPWDERNTPELALQGIINRLMREFAVLPDANALAIAPPSLPGFGSSGGFSFVLQDRSGTLSISELGENLQNFLAAARKRPELTRLFSSFDSTVPQLALEVDREKVRTLGVPLTDVFATLQTSLGGAYVNDFNRFGRLYRVYVQAESKYRQRPSDIGQFYVRSATT